MNEELRIHVDEYITGYGGGAVLLPRDPRRKTLVVKQAERERETRPYHGAKLRTATTPKTLDREDSISSHTSTDMEPGW